MNDEDLRKIENKLRQDLIEDQLKRIEVKWKEIAGEEINIIIIDNDLKAFCSAPAVVRLFKKYHHLVKAEVGYDIENDAFFFIIKDAIYDYVLQDTFQFDKLMEF